MVICDKRGRILATSNPPDSRIFDGMTIHNAHLVGVELEGVSFNDSDLRGSDFSGADLYGASFMGANCESCKFVGVDLRSSRLYGASFRNSDLRDACFGLDQMGGAVAISGVDFSNAKLDGADFSGAVHEETTVFPEGFYAHERCFPPKT